LANLQPEASVFARSYVNFNDLKFHIMLTANTQPIVAVEENQLSVTSPNGQRLPAPVPNDVFLQLLEFLGMKRWDQSAQLRVDCQFRSHYQ
jgi:hypothetical protein